jgi:hypothetical protein
MNELRYSGEVHEQGVFWDPPPLPRFLQSSGVGDIEKEAIYEGPAAPVPPAAVRLPAQAY